MYHVGQPHLCAVQNLVPLITYRSSSAGTPLLHLCAKYRELHLVVEQLSSESIGEANLLGYLGEGLARCLFGGQQLPNQIVLACSIMPIFRQPFMDHTQNRVVLQQSQSSCQSWS